MHINLPPPPPPPTPQDVVDTANDIINDVTGGGSGDTLGGPPVSGGGGNTGVLLPGVNVFMCPAPPAPFVPVPYPVAFTENTSHDAASDNGSAGGTSPPSGGGGGQSVTFGNARPRHRDGIVQQDPHVLSLAVQAIAIAMGHAASLGTGVPVAIVALVALVPTARDKTVPRGQAAVTKTLDAILHRFTAHARGPEGRHKIQHLRTDLVAAIGPGLLEAARLHRVYGVNAEALARRHLIALLRGRTRHA